MPPVEFDRDEARQWMLAVEQGESRGGIGTGDEGVFGDRVALLDFDPDDLARLRALVPHVRLVAHPAVESAIAIAGSSAQGKVQLFPGDADFFERTHVHAADEAAAASILRDVMRATALRALDEPDVVLVEVNFGVTPSGDSILWKPADLVAGRVTVDDGGTTRTLEWDDVDIGDGWVYLGWIVAERDANRIALASNMVDATWEDPAGAIHSLDGAVDPLAQEVYLEADALPLVERVARSVPPGARDAYREAMRSEVHHYTVVEPAFAKAAKRLYNLFRVSDELESAAYVRELFDEPSARLYQVPGLLDAADAALDPGSGIDRATVLRQLDLVSEAVAEVTSGTEEQELLAALAELREAAQGEGRSDEDWAAELARVRARSAAIVNEFFRRRLLEYRRVREALEEIARGPGDA